MSEEEHQRVMGICYPNKCYVEVPTKADYDITAAMAEEHEERLANITKEVDGALSCESVITSGTITSTGKINANGGLAVTSLTASGTITANGIINANGGLALSGDIVGNLKGNVTGNVTGKINVSTYATSGDVTLGVLSFSNSSIATTAFLTSNSCTCGTASFTKKNTSLINYTGSTPAANATATITVTFKNNDTSINKTVKQYGWFYVTVKNNTTGATIMSNTSLKTSTGIASGSTANVSTTFTRASNNTYTVTVSGYKITNASSGSDSTSAWADECQYSVSVTTTGGATVYVP